MFIYIITRATLKHNTHYVITEVRTIRAVQIELFTARVLLEYSIEYLIEYSSTRWIPEVAINHRVVQNKRIPGSSFKFVI